MAGEHDFLPPPADEDPQAWVRWADAISNSARLGLVCSVLEPEHARFTMRAAPMVNTRGWAHGGLVMAAADHCMGLVAHRGVRGATVSTASFHAQFLRPARVPLELDVRVVKRGSRLTFLEAAFAAADGEPCALCQATLVVSAP